MGRDLRQAILRKDIDTLLAYLSNEREWQELYAERKKALSDSSSSLYANLFDSELLNRRLRRSKKLMSAYELLRRPETRIAVYARQDSRAECWGWISYGSNRLSSADWRRLDLKHSQAGWKITCLFGDACD